MPGTAPPQACCTLQGRACRLHGKEDAQDFQRLVKALRVLGLCAEELAAVWAVLATILHLGNICFSSSEVGFPVGRTAEHAGRAVVVCTVGAMMMPSHCVEKRKAPGASESSQMPIVQIRTVSPSDGGPADL